MANRFSRLVAPAYAPSYDGRYHLRYPRGDKPVQGAELEAIALSQMAASGNLSAAIRLAAIAQGRVAAAGALSTAIRLNAAAQGDVSFWAAFAGPPQPTHFVAPDGSESGIGTISNPMTLSRACQLAQPGWRVRMAPGVYVGPNRNNKSDASFMIATPGQPNNRIIFFAENYAALSTTGRTIIQNDATQQGYGCPVISVGTGHEWIGLDINENNAKTTPDTGPIVMAGQFMAVRYCRISRGDTPWPAEYSDNNHAAIRIEPAQFVEITDNWIEGYSGINSVRSEQAIQLYSHAGNPTHSILIEHNVFDLNEVVLTSKGNASAGPIAGGIIARRNISRASGYMRGGVAGGHYMLMDTDWTQGRNQFYLNLMMGGAWGVSPHNQANQPIRGIDVINNTHIGTVANGEVDGMFNDRGSNSGGSPTHRMHNNIKTGNASVARFSYETTDAGMLSRSHNLGYGQAENNWGYAGNRGQLSLAQWQSAGWDANSLVADPQFVSTAWGNANLGRLALTSAARNAGIDILRLLGGSPSAPIDLGCFIGDGISLGIRPLS
jgi:hypothetical protein